MARKGTLRKRWQRASNVEGPKGTNHLHKLHVKKGDMVEVMSGADKGKRGTVLESFPADGKITVEGVNRRWKHLRRSQENPQGGRIERDYPIHACKVRKVES